MKILNIGSLNIDKVYAMDHFVAAGETLASRSMDTFPGGKGLNQSVALARAGAEVYAAGAVGPDGQFLVDILRQSGANVDHILHLTDVDTGHAIIQVNPSGQNCIITAPGANGRLSEEYIDATLDSFGPGDLLLLQNETSNIPYIMRRAKERGLRVAINASPITPGLLSCPLELVDYFIINELEGQAIAGIQDTDFEKILDSLLNKFPQTAVVLTLGGEGVLYGKGDHRARHGIFKVNAVDTTAAGDTFCGYFLASLSKGLEVEEALRVSSAASAIAVSGKGAAVSIPTWDQVEEFLKKQG